MNKILTLAACLTVTALLQSQTIIRVTPDGTGDGTSWTTACNLEEAISVIERSRSAASLNDQTEIWVQAGTYQPSAMLIVPESVKVYGGFSGTETDLLQRDWVGNPTIVDGQHKIGSVFRLQISAEINGLIIQNGNANGNSQQNGGGVWADENAVIENCIIKNNVAMLNGGGIYAKGRAILINNTIEGNTANGSGMNTFGNCLLIAKSALSSTPCEAPVITSHPSTASVGALQDANFPPLNVSASGTNPLTYQWYCHADPTNIGGANLGNHFTAQTDAYIPHAAIIGGMHYYCVVSNACGSAVSEISGLHTTTLSAIDLTSCSTNSFSPGTIYYGSGNTNINSGTTTIKGYVDGVPMTQTWSAHISTSNCNKTTFAPSTSADCRNNGSYSHMFSSCAVRRFASTFCPAPWRVPTGTDFVNLDKALRGEGASRVAMTPEEAQNYYINTWGGAYGGYAYAGGLGRQGEDARYWSQTRWHTGDVKYLLFGKGFIHAQDLYPPNVGLSLRCVK